MSSKRFSNVVGFDDAPFDRLYQGPVPIVGAVFAGSRLDGVIMGQVEKDGADAAMSIAGLLSGSRFLEHIQLIMLQGITLAGFNVVDIRSLYHELELPVLVVTSKAPDLTAIRNALINHVPNGPEKWRTILSLDIMVPAGVMFIQWIGLTYGEAAETVRRHAINGHMPEPLRAAHLIASALGRETFHEQ